MKWAQICVQRLHPTHFLLLTHPYFSCFHELTVSKVQSKGGEMGRRTWMSNLSTSFPFSWSCILYPSMHFAYSQLVGKRKWTWSLYIQKFKPIPQFGDFRSNHHNKISVKPYCPQGNRTRAGGSISQFCDLLLLLLYLICQRLHLSFQVSYLISIVLSFLKIQQIKVRVESRLGLPAIFGLL